MHVSFFNKIFDLKSKCHNQTLFGDICRTSPNLISYAKSTSQKTINNQCISKSLPYIIIFFTNLLYSDVSQYKKKDHQTHDIEVK